MSQIVLDIGSGNTLTDEVTAIKLIDAVMDRDTKKHEVIFKTQLFQHAPPNKPLDHRLFQLIRAYAWAHEYKVTSSVFDKPSLTFLLLQETDENPLPFVKIACRPDLYWLIGEVPRRIPVYVSVQTDKEKWPTEWEEDPRLVTICCVPEYPALAEDYPWNPTGIAFSDHTVGLEIWDELKPKIWEKHICLERDPNNPDSGPFALVPEDLGGIL